jgi:hypothetical protein
LRTSANRNYRCWGTLRIVLLWVLLNIICLGHSETLLEAAISPVIKKGKSGACVACYSTKNFFCGHIETRGRLDYECWKERRKWCYYTHTLWRHFNKKYIAKDPAYTYIGPCFHFHSENLHKGTWKDN